MKICLPYKIIRSLKAGSIFSSSLPKAFHLAGEMFVELVNEDKTYIALWLAVGWITG